MGAGHSRQGGFTLIEVMLALTVFAVGALGVAQLVAASVIRSQRLWRLSQAQSATMGRVETRMASCPRATGRVVLFVEELPAGSGLKSDTIATYLPC